MKEAALSIRAKSGSSMGSMMSSGKSSKGSTPSAQQISSADSVMPLRKTGSLPGRRRSRASARRSSSRRSSLKVRSNERFQERPSPRIASTSGAVGTALPSRSKEEGAEESAAVARTNRTALKGRLAASALMRSTFQAMSVRAKGCASPKRRMTRSLMRSGGKRQESLKHAAAMRSVTVMTLPFLETRKWPALQTVDLGEVVRDRLFGPEGEGFRMGKRGDLGVQRRAHRGIDRCHDAPSPMKWDNASGSSPTF